MSTQTKRVLRRSRNDKVFAGVAGGLAEFTGISSFWFRLAFIIALIPGGVPGIAAYLVLMVVMPRE